MNHPPILIHFNETGDRLAVWNSSGHPDNWTTKETLKDLGYRIETFGEVYTITDPMPEWNSLDKIKTSLEALYGISEGDRSDEALNEKEPT